MTRPDATEKIGFFSGLHLAIKDFFAPWKNMVSALFSMDRLSQSNLPTKIFELRPTLPQT